MKLSFKFIKPWTWNCLKRKPKQVMIPVTAAAIAEALYANDDLYEQVTDDMEEMAMDDEEEEEEQQEPPFWLDEVDSTGAVVDPTLNEQLSQIIDDPERDGIVENYAPDFQSSVNLAMTGSHDTRTVREKFNDECG